MKILHVDLQKGNKDNIKNKIEGYPKGAKNYITIFIL